MRALATIATLIIFGHPLIMYSGIIVFASFLLTATIAVMNHRGNHLIPFKWHPVVARISLLLGIIHGLLGISLYY